MTRLDEIREHYAATERHGNVRAIIDFRADVFDLLALVDKLTEERDAARNLLAVMIEKFLKASTARDLIRAQRDALAEALRDTRYELNELVQASIEDTGEPPSAGAALAVSKAERALASLEAPEEREESEAGGET